MQEFSDYTVLGDIQLAALLAKGDEIAFAVLYDRHHPLIYNYVLYFVKIPALAEDLVHDVFMKLWEARDRMQINISVTAYLYRVSRNHVFRKLKKISSEKELREAIMRQLELPPDDSAERMQLIQRHEQLLEEAMSRLPPKRQQVFRLCRLEGKTYDQAALLMGVSRNAIKEHMVLSMRFIKEYFFQHGEILLLFYIYLNANSLQ